MLEQLKQLPGNQPRIEFESLLEIPAHKVQKRRAFKWKVIDFFKDLDFFIDFCLARWIVWRELHREKRVGKRGLP